MIKNISQIIGYHNTSEKIIKIFYKCKGHKISGYATNEIVENCKEVPICKNCNKFQCNMHISKNKDLCMSCAKFGNICNAGNKNIEYSKRNNRKKCTKFMMCNCCSKIVCNCELNLKMYKTGTGGSYVKIICDEHYEEQKSDPDVIIYGLIRV